MPNPDRHLQEIELRKYAQGREESAGVHIADCDLCALRLRLIKAETGEAGDDSNPECPVEPHLWYEFAGGSLPDADAERLIKHAIDCRKCGSAIRRVSEEINQEFSAEELAIIDSLNTNTVAWQQRTADRLSRASSASASVRQNTASIRAMEGAVAAAGEERVIPQSARSEQGAQENLAARFARLMGNDRKSAKFAPARWGFAVAAMVVIGFTTMWIMNLYKSHPQPDRVQALMQQAYAERRPFALRLVGAGYGDIRNERGPSGSDFDAPSSLRDAKVLIAKHLESHADDPAVLFEKGRADLLDGHYDSAIADLERSLALGFKSSSAKVDLATAYYQNGLKTGRNLDLARSLELLGQVIVSEPNLSAAYFNRAIVEEKMFLFGPAAADWKRYLELDGSSEWAAEAKRRSRELSERINHHSGVPGHRQSRQMGAMETPASIIYKMDRDYEISVITMIAQNLDQARPETQNSLPQLAMLLKNEGGDDWLAAVLKEKPGARGDEGWKILGQAIVENQNGHHESAHKLAERSAQIFHSQQDYAAEYRARFESVYALHLYSQGQQCSSEASGLLNHLRERNFRWLEIQTLLELSVCSHMANKIELAKGLALEALRKSQTNVPYLSLALRSQIFLSEIDLSLGDSEAALSRILDALSTYWGGDFASSRAYNLYASMEYIASDLREWNVSVAILRQSVALLSGDPDLIKRGIEQHRLAASLLMAGDLAQSAQNARLAGQLFAQNGENKSISIYRAETEVTSAKIDLLRHLYKESLERLQAIETDLPESEDIPLAFDLYLTRGLANAGLGKDENARNDLEKASAYAQLGLANLKVRQERYRWSQRFGEVNRALVRLTLKQDPSAAFTMWERYRSAELTSGLRPGGSQQKLNTPPYSSSTVVSFGIFPDGLATWVLSGKQLNFNWEALDSEELASSLSTYKLRCASPRSSLQQIRREGLKIYSRLFQPIENLIKNSASIAVETDGPLDNFPFETLVDPRDRLLADRFNFAYSPGLNYWPVSPAPLLNDRNSHAVIAGAAESQAGLAVLDDTESEAREVSSHLAGSTLLTGASLTWPSLERDLRSAVIFHFAGHAITGQNGVKLILGNQTSSTPAPSPSLSRALLPQAKLVVLSACATAGGASGSFNDADSTARSLISGGIPQVIASRWPVDSASTKLLMQSFYSEFANTNGMAALNAAEKTIRTNSRTAHPFYWAGFAIYGKS